MFQGLFQDQKRDLQDEARRISYITVYKHIVAGIPENTIYYGIVWSLVELQDATPRRSWL